MRTLKDLQNDDSDDEGVDNEKGQAFYAGGSEHSGQQILGPPRKKEGGEDANKLVESVFEQARQFGAVARPDSPPDGPGSSRRMFGGSGFRLGTETEPTGGAAAPGGPVVSGEPTEDNEGGREVSPPRQVMITMWANGFSVDDGALRDYHSPESAEFMDSIRHGHVPTELLALHNRDGEVLVDLKDRRFEDFQAPTRKQAKAFVGHGHRLGGLDGGGSDAVEPPLPAVSAGDTAAADLKQCEELAAKLVGFDPTAPVATVQIRLADGSRLVAKLNHSNTVQQLRQYITIARPQYAASTFALLTTFPNRELTDEKQNLKDAQLIGAVVVQKLT